MSLNADGPLAILTDYDIRHIVTHPLWAGPDRDVHRLLDLEITEERHNGWFAEPGFRIIVLAWSHGSGSDLD